MAKGKYEEWRTEDGLERLGAWARDGLTDQDIADNMHISVKTLYKWKRSYSDICDALRKNKDIADIKVENALYKRCIGYKYTEHVIEMNGKGVRSTKKTEKEMPPDVVACLIWLKNRKPKVWRDKQEVEVTGNISIADALKAARARVIEREDK